MKNILVFNDISGLGNCSMVANLAIFSHLGHNVMPIVTAHYSAQTGFDNYDVLLNDNVRDFAQNVLQNRKADAIYVGFCNNVNTLKGVAEVVNDNQNSFVLVDPILGDNGKMYSVFNNDYLQEMKKIVAFADVITPNLTEACFLCDVDYDKLIARQSQPTFLATVGQTFADILTETGAKNVVITGVPCGELVGNVVVTKDGTKYVTNQRTQVNYSGTGDLFSSVLLGELLKSANLLQATQLSAIFVGNCARQTQCADGRFGVEFATLLPILK